MIAPPSSLGKLRTLRQRFKENRRSGTWIITSEVTGVNTDFRPFSAWILRARMLD
jgi:hypothetical protein